VAANVKYFYLRLQDSFFDGEEIKVLEGMRNGHRYLIFYLKLCLLSLKDGGRLLFKNCIPYDIGMLSTILRVNIDIVRSGMEILTKLRLLEVLSSGEIFINDIQKLIGHSSTEAERLVKYRERIKKAKTLPGTNVPGAYPNIDLDLDTDLEGRGESTEVPPSFDDEIPEDRPPRKRA
jgi:predicted phage replisome organizer